jgi:two-component sensor histidine kinase
MASRAHFTLTPDALAVREARLRLRAFDDLPAQTRADAELVVSELVANSLLHARLGPDELIDVTLRRRDRCLSIEVDDHGRFSGRPRGRRGAGLRVLDTLCEDWHAEAGRVSASIRI